MDLRLLTYFLAVVDHGGVTRAAKALYIAQPSLSQAIRGLEGAVGVPLFERSGRPLALTEAGRIFETGARAALADADDARAKVTAVRELRAGRLRIATTPLLALDPLPSAAAQLRSAYPHIQLHISAPEHVVDEIRLGSAEIGVVYDDVATGSLERRHVVDQRLGLVVAEERGVGLPRPYPLERLGELPLVQQDDDGSDHLTDVATSYAARIVARSAYPLATLELARQGLGAALLPIGLAAARRPDLVVLETDPPIIRRVIAVHRRTNVSPAAAAFLDIIGRHGAGPPTVVHRRAPSRDGADGAGRRGSSDRP